MLGRAEISMKRKKTRGKERTQRRKKVKETEKCVRDCKEKDEKEKV